MHTFEITDSKQALRFRVAQFNGKSITFPLDGTTIAGLVRSVSERKSTDATRWIITIVPERPAVSRSMR
jgi:hypothetical protein